ncbi:unnamed protein product [Cochlearia groenlandica]
MASKSSSSSANTPDLLVGSVVSFTSGRVTEFFHGTVYFYNPDDASFGIEAVSRTKQIEDFNRVEGYYQFFLKDVKNLKVLRKPPPKPRPATDTTTKDDDKSTTGEASSSGSK